MTAAPVTAPRFIFPARPVNGGALDKARTKYGEHGYEPKLNGWRAEVDVPTRTFWNRHGKLLSIAEEFDEAFAKLQAVSAASGITRFDCEALERRHGIGKGSLFVLDWIPVAPAASIPSTLPSIPSPNFTATWLQRNAALDAHLARLPYTCQPDAGGLYRPDLVPGTLETWAELQRMNREWGAEFYEGLVAKRLDSPYPLHHTSASQETPAWMKHRWAF